MKQIGWRTAAVAALLGLCFPAAAQIGPSTGIGAVGETAAWEAVKNSDSADSLKAFLDKYPKGANAREARQRYSLAANTMLPAEIQKIDVKFPNDARRIGRSLGALRVVTLDLLVRADGSVDDVDLAKSSGFDAYDKEAQSAARQATLLPAVNRGKPVESRLSYDVSFGLLCNRAAGNHSCDDRRFPTTCSATVCETLLR
jgi:TonB family protein